MLSNFVFFILFGCLFVAILLHITYICLVRVLTNERRKINLKERKIKYCSNEVERKEASWGWVYLLIFLVWICASLGVASISCPWNESLHVIFILFILHQMKILKNESPSSSSFFFFFLSLTLVHAYLFSDDALTLSFR